MWIEREISSRVRKLSESFPAIILTGARQTGKTSLLRHIFPDYRYISLDLPILAEQAEESPESFLRDNPPPVIIDEVQYAPQLFRLVFSISRKCYYAASTLTSANFADRAFGFTMISMSQSKAFKNLKSRSIENPSS